MTIKELEEYQVICSKGSLSQAAKALFITPQGLSRVLKNLETELDCTLVNRVASGLVLTKSGEYLLEYAQETTAQYQKLKDAIDSIQDSVHGSVDLLMAYDLIRLLEPGFFGEFQKLYPGISFACREYPDRVAERMLAEGQANAALSIGPFAGDLFHIRPLQRCPLCLVVPEEHPLCEKTAVHMEDLKDEPLYIENSYFKINEFVQRSCWLRGFEPNIVFEASSFDICYKLCREKRGISVVPAFIHGDMKADGLVTLPFADPEMALEIALLTRKNKANEPAVDKLFGCLKNRLG